jgi:hypothetical protein
MIVNKLDLIRIAIPPAQADAPLIIDANTVLARSVAFEFLQAVAGRDSQVFELLGRVNEPELPQHRPLQVSREAPHGLALKEPLDVPISKALDHSR